MQRLEAYGYLLEADGVVAADATTLEPVEAINLSELILSKMMEMVRQLVCLMVAWLVLTSVHRSGGRRRQLTQQIRTLHAGR